jgi:hypothetical protein
MENRIADAKMTHYYRPQKSNESSDETHSHRHDRPTDMPMVVLYKENHRQCRWFQKALAMHRKNILL